ncbi:HEPN domain-containing protein [Azospirillum sp. sgz302134]
MSGDVASHVYWMQAAFRDLRSARLLFDDGDVDGAASRLYYAMFHAATAAFATRQRTIKTHHQLVGEFGRQFVESGVIPRELGRALNVALEMRRVSDYAMLSPDVDRLTRLFDDAEAFLAAVQEVVGGYSG